MDKLSGKKQEAKVGTQKVEMVILLHNLSLMARLAIEGLVVHSHKEGHQTVLSQVILPIIQVM